MSSTYIVQPTRTNVYAPGVAPPMTDASFQVLHQGGQRRPLYLSSRVVLHLITGTVVRAQFASTPSTARFARCRLTPWAAATARRSWAGIRSCASSTRECPGHRRACLPVADVRRAAGPSMWRRRTTGTSTTTLTTRGPRHGACPTCTRYSGSAAPVAQYNDRMASHEGQVFIAEETAQVAERRCCRAAGRPAWVRPRPWLSFLGPCPTWQ